MPVTRLATRRIDKVWGRRTLGLGFADPAPGAEPVGEIWFEAPDGRPDALLVKYLFTSEKLSVQVHPDDEQARAAGQPSGKEECWLILEAEPGATIGIGLTREVSAGELRSAARDGSIEALLDWKPVAPGDVVYLPAGTVHAIGAGVTLLEIQQNADITYRLYDYGRPRALHLEEAVAVARGAPWQAPSAERTVAPGRTILAEGRKFVIERWDGGTGQLTATPARPVWLVPLDGNGEAGGEPLEAGGAWVADEPVPIAHGGTLIAAYPGGEVNGDLLGS